MSEADIVFILSGLWMLLVGFLSGWSFGWLRGYGKAMWRMSQEGRDE